MARAGVGGHNHLRGLKSRTLALIKSSVCQHNITANPLTKLPMFLIIFGLQKTIKSGEVVLPKPGCTSGDRAGFEPCLSDLEPFSFYITNCYFVCFLPEFP